MTERADVLVVLHAHLPWVWPEHDDSVEGRWAPDAGWACHRPLAALLERLADDGLDAPIAVTLSPPLASTWRDPVLAAFAGRHRARVRALAEALAAGPRAPALRDHLARLDEAERGPADPAAGLARLHREGRVELVATAASHGFLPGLGPRARRAQVALGLAFFEALVGAPPVCFWLPECAFEPSLEPLLAELGAGIAFVDGHALELATPRPPLAARAPVLSPSGVLFFARDRLSVEAVWSSATGYPARPVYREFFADVADGASEALLTRHGLLGPFGARLPTGLKPLAISGAPYDPAAARAQAERDADDLVERLARTTGEPTPLGPEVRVLAFDAELFGHHWWEGLAFLERLLRRLAAHDRLALARPSARAERCPEAFVATPGASTWGRGGFSRTWAGERTGPLWREVHASEAAIAAARPRAVEEAAALARAWLLLQASDWAFLHHEARGGTFPAAEVARRAAAVRRLARGEPGAAAGDERFLAALPAEALASALGPPRGTC